MECIGVAIICFMVAGGLWCRREEQRIWNNGLCNCGEPWLSFDVSSQGCRGYTCRSPMHVHAPYMWITYPGVDKP
jgi:hypothetical protein